jgi:GTP pyrophosphokinase
MSKDYIEALKFAMEKHKHQTRTNGDPYILHPIRVAETLRSAGLPVNHPVVVASLLHDLIEDCGVNYGTINYHFKGHVADIVAGMTDDNRMTKKEKSADMLDRMARAKAEIQIVKLADRLDNLTDDKPWDEKNHRRKLEESLKLLKITKPKGTGSDGEFNVQQSLAMVHMWLHTEVEKQIEEAKQGD